MNNNIFPINQKKKPRNYSYIKRQRSLQSQKKMGQSKEISKTITKPQVLKTQVKVLVQAVPMNQQFIQQYIEQLKQKLSSIRNTPKQKCFKIPQNNQIFKKRRRSIQISKQKTKAKSVERQPLYQYRTKSMNFMNQNKIPQFHKLQNLNDVRNSFKRYKEYYNSSQRRIATEKNKYRYADDDQLQKKIEVQNTTKQKKQNSVVRFRSNTQQVIRSNIHPPRINRHSSLKKHNKQIDSNGNTFNNFFFDKIVNVNRNIHIFPIQTEQSIKYPEKYKKNEQRMNSLQNKKFQEENIRLETNCQTHQKIGDLSTINARKQTINFLGDSCLGIKQQLKEQKGQKSEQLLDFLDWKTKQLKNAFLNGKKKQKKNALEKLSKIFPKGFFT